MSLLSWLSGARISEAEIRSEIWKLGGRHRGSPLEGAIDELKADDLPAHQAQLLRACIRRLQAR
ncbi:MAG: hypothetical protein U1C74_04820 [Phenylobacterium sp.]|nr:hypothetical protein [Phenylobacterium sp.]